MAANILYFLGLFCVVIFCVTPLNEAKIVEGTIVPSVKHDGNFVNWAFITRFCFKSDRSHVEFEMYFPKRYYMQTLLLYYDAANQWPAVYPPRNKTCMQRLQPLRGANQMLPLKVIQNMTPFEQFQVKYPWTRAWFDWERCDMDQASERIVCKFDLTFRSVRDRWWYIAVANCEGHEGLYLNYKINLTNGPPGDVFFHHFSADEFYILQVDLIFLVAQFVILIVTSITAYYLCSLDFYHVTFKLFVTSMAFEIIHLISSCWENGVYAHTGRDSRFATYISLLFQTISYILFIIMLILLGKGYTITRGRLRTAAIIKLTIFIVAYIVLYLGMFLWEMLIFDEGLVMYRYASAPGYGLVIMRVVAWVWFLYGCCFTLKHYPEKKRFFIPFVIIFSIWFLTGPFMVLVAVFLIPPWVRATTMNGVENTVTLLGQIVFLILTRPSKANSTFPFRIRTWQIAVMEGEEVGPEAEKAYGVAAKYLPDNDVVNMFTATEFRDTKPRRRNVGNIDKFPHHEENDTSHFEIAVQPAR